VADDLFGPLAQGPVPPLAPASVVRARGDQRRRRTGRALAGTAMAVVALAAVTGYAVVAPDGEPDAVRPAPAASAEGATPSASPLTTPTGAAPVRAEQVLDAATVASVSGGSWASDGADRDNAHAPWAECSEVPPAEAGRLRRLRSTSGRTVGHVVLRYADVASARAQLERWLADLERCPVRQLAADDATDAWAPLAELPGEGPERAYASVTSTPSCSGCEQVVTTVALSVVDEHLSYVSVTGPEVGDLSALADAADLRVRGEVAADSAPTSPGVDDLLLSPADADAAEPGSWREADQEGADPRLLDPCTGGTDYPRDADRVDRAATALGSSREAGDTSVVQTVARYASTSAARDAAEGYERAVRGCPSEEGGEELPGSRRTHQVVEEWSDLDGVRTLYVRTEGTCDGCSPAYGYYAVQQVGDLVSVLSVAVGEDGDPGDGLVRPFAAQVARRLA
jgi:hypothetical protein